MRLSWVELISVEAEALPVTSVSLPFFGANLAGALGCSDCTANSFDKAQLLHFGLDLLSQHHKIFVRLLFIELHEVNTRWVLIKSIHRVIRHDRVRAQHCGWEAEPRLVIGRIIR